MQAVQLLIGGGEEAVCPERTELQEFRTLNVQEEGLLTVSQAAVILDVSPTRVDQLIQAGKFRSWVFLKNRYVSSKDVLLRRTSDIQNGRPARSLGQRVRVAARVVAKSTVAQVLS